MALSILSSPISIHQIVGVEPLRQLLEYAYSARGFEPQQLYVVAEPELDKESAAYIKRLNNEFNLKIEYHRLQVPTTLNDNDIR